ncbi:MAG: ribonucleoside-diphosphate reductase subunit alpha [Crocinitomicaceae bacterium]|nr:ribonucleoside-diphosphate reductase subunit alpha [Crocinitomicaceae bacterium]
MSQTMITKRKGVQEPLQIEKIHKVLMWAKEAAEKVYDRPLDISVSQVELSAQLQFVNGMTTEAIHETLIKSAADLISPETPDYDIYAGILSLYHIRKKAYGDYEVPRLYDHVVKMVEAGKYDKAFLTDFTEAEFDLMDSFVEQDRDLTYQYAAMKQFEGKYLVQDRVKGTIFETPQVLYVLIAATMFSGYPKDIRMDYIRRMYDATSKKKISFPTPIMGGVRTPTRQFSSCVVIDTDDSLDSINASSSSIVKYVSQRAGIGINAGVIRGLGSPIRNGEAFHTGCIPFFKHFQTAVKSCSQGGIRGGAATLFYPIWHIESPELLVLKNNRGVDENRVRHLDYGVQFNRLMYQRLQKSGNITLFSPNDVPGLYDAFFADQDKFEKLYVKYEADESIRKRTVKAVDLFGTFMQERSGTGRIYLQNVDHCNTHSAFNPEVAPIRQSNLCMEITLPTKPLEHSHDENGEISLCTLSAFNLGAIESLDELEELADLLVRGLDFLLSYQDYPVPAAKKSTLSRRPIGAGVINYAYYLAKNGLKYSDGSANELTHQTFEAIQFYLLKASNQLAKEQGACSAFGDTTYAQGLLPIDTYAKKVDDLCNTPLLLDWESLRAEIKEHGLRNSTLTALMPSETSSQISNATNGIEPPRGFISVKASKDGVLKQVVPEYHRLKDNYELLWDIPDNTGYLSLVAIMQKFVDQSISANTDYDPMKFPNGKVPMKQLFRDMLFAYVHGVKTLYYHNTRDHANSSVDDIASQAANAESRDVVVEKEDEGCEGGACKI